MALLALLILPAIAVAENWPQWRGPRGDGTCAENDVLTEWNVASNSAWKTAVPGLGHSSPIIWEDRVFTASALRQDQERLLLSLDRRTGRVLWQRSVVQAPLEKKNKENSFASGTPATDGEKVYVSFLAGQDVVVSAYDLSGKQIWQSRPGQFGSPHGYSGSPILFKDKVIVVGDNTGESWVAALSRADGKTLWKVPREQSHISFGTPLIRSAAGRTQMFVAGNTCVTSYDPNDGSRLWFAGGPSDQVVASTIYSEPAGLLFATGGYPQRILLALKVDGSGDVSQTCVAWRSADGAAYVPSPILEGDYLLTVTPSTVMYCLQASTGKVLWKQKMVKHHASPVSIRGLVYFIDDNGQINVIKPGPAFERVAQYELGEPTYASPAISGGQVFLRGERSLWCLGPVAKR
jgi:outer membrane protein assembly factor BamB